MLNLSSLRHTEQFFKQILGGCRAIIDGSRLFRNQADDAYGQGKNNIKLSVCHAELVVNLARTMLLFLFSK